MHGSSLAACGIGCASCFGFAVYDQPNLLGNAFHAVLVHRLTIATPRFLPTLDRPHELHVTSFVAINSRPDILPQVCAQAERAKK